MIIGSTVASATGTRTRPDAGSAAGSAPVRLARTAAARSSQARLAGSTSSTWPPDRSFS